ncbi:myb-like protein U [Drosophila tropicalis]|uniref:myb-like protein U n=1 Tax=Drosophila tropicalis TaxID=46794 RepID=UPI0035AB9093
MEHILNEVKGNVEKKFNEIRAALHMREKLLLRQLEVIANTQKQQQMLKPGRRGGGDCTSDADGDIQFITGDGDEEDKLLAAIRTFGHFQLDNNNMQFALQDYRNTGLRNEDYIEPIDDHETMYKCLQERKIAYAYDLDVNDVHDVDGDEAAPPNAEAIVVDFTNKSLIEDNNINAKRSIINITLQEAKELVRKAKIKRDSAVVVPPLNLEELDDELESSIAEAVSSLGRDGRDSSRSKSSTLLQHGKSPPASTQKQSQQQQRKPRFKPKITINNCNGTINLRNIASLTINCAQEEAVSAEIPLAKPPQSISADSSSSNTTTNTNTTDQSISTASSSSYSSNASSRSQSKKQKSNKTKKSTQAIPTSNQHEAEAEEAVSTNSNSYQFEEVVVEQDTHDVTCDFYNRLLDEIKKSMKEKPRRIYTTTAPADSTCNANTQPTKIAPPAPPSMSRTTGTTTNTNKENDDNEDDASELPSSMSSHLQPGKRLILKNFENLKIILEANSGDEDSFHPVQIEQWLAEIISETDLEPMQNTDILEHSQIHSSESN